MFTMCRRERRYNKLNFQMITANALDVRALERYKSNDLSELFLSLIFLCVIAETIEQHIETTTTSILENLKQTCLPRLEKRERESQRRPLLRSKQGTERRE